MGPEERVGMNAARMRAAYLGEEWQPDPGAV